MFLQPLHVIFQSLFLLAALKDLQGVWLEVYGQDAFHLHPLDLPLESFDHLSSDEYLSHHLARGGELQVIVRYHYAQGHLLGLDKLANPLLHTVAQSNKVLQGLWLEASDGDGEGQGSR